MIRMRRLLGFACAVLLSGLVSFAGLSAARADTTPVVQGGMSFWNGTASHQVSVAELMHAHHLRSDVTSMGQTPPTPDLDTFRISARRHDHASLHDTAAIGKLHRQPTSHIVQAGDTLWDIACMHHTSVEQLMAWNGLTSDLIRPGQRLLIYHNHKSNAPDLIRGDAERIDGIPSNLIPIYQGAGRTYNIPWTILAAIHRKETDFSTGREVSSAGAEGPMQFMPATFQEYGVTAPGRQGPPDINNVYDAIYSCAHMLAADGFQQDPVGALYLYDHSFAYVDAVRQLAHKYAV